LKTGIFSISESDYRPAPYLNKSGLDALAKSPGHYQWSLKNYKPPTPEMGFGTAFHSFVLEPEDFEHSYMVIEDVSRASKFYKECEVEAQKLSKKILFESDLERIKNMSEALLKHSRVKDLMSGGKPEQVMYWTMETSTGGLVECKAKVDYIRDGCVLDLKTTKNASKDDFTKSIHNYRYHIQDGFYRLGANALTDMEHEFYFIAVESEPPHGVNVFSLGEKTRNLAYSEIHKLVDRYEECLKTNYWPFYPQDIHCVDLPGYAFYKS
jgi:exodeoxyribonuclease VIII